MINESSPATLPAGIPGLGPGRLLGIDAGDGERAWFGAFGAPVCWAAFTGLTGAVRPLAPPEVGAALLAGAPQASFARQPGNILAGVACGGDRG